MNNHPRSCLSALAPILLGTCAGVLFPSAGIAQAPPADTAVAKEIYSQLKAFALTGGVAAAENLTLKRDRAVITFQSGMLYFSAPVEGKVRGAVFIGSGTFHADVPPSDFERDNLNRLLKADAVESDFKTAVLQFTDDTFNRIGASIKSNIAAPTEATKLAAEFERRVLKETGANVPARLTISIVDKESPGFFVAEFDKGKRGRFTLLLDRQCRIPTTHFGINAGEIGLIFESKEGDEANVWMAFPGLEDYERGQAVYSDLFNVVDIPHYDLWLDLRERKTLKLTAQMELVSRVENLRAIPFALSEDLPARDDIRKKKGLRVTAARLADGKALDFFQEESEGGLTLVLPSVLPKGQKLSVQIDAQGDFMRNSSDLPTNYPMSNETWYPRHGDLLRSTFDVTFLHPKDRHIASAGRRLREESAPDDKNNRITEFRIDEPIPVITFAIGPFEVHRETAQISKETAVPVEFYSLPGSVTAIKEDFILAELSNSVRYFSEMFGPYPYPVFRAVFHPFDFGQGFPTLLMIPATDSATSGTFSFIAHETSHQWWGDIVLWRSYRDQWLSEGFAEYSGLLYTRFRHLASSPQSARKPTGDHDLLNELRDSLKDPPRTQVGIGRGRLVDVGPIIMGHRLNTRETEGAYTTLVYNKGALVLRMLHFLFTDPQNGDGTAFFDMMKDFAHQYQNSAASTEAFFAVANGQVSQTPLAKKYGYRDLNWFLRQWVMQTYLPSYRFEYHIEDRPNQMFAVKGTLLQEGPPETEQWFMPLPLVLHFGGNKVASGTIAAHGMKTPVEVMVPLRPEKVELDPERWILSEKTETKKVGANTY